MFCNATITSMMLDWLILIPNFGLGMRRVPWPEMREMEGKGEGGKVVRERVERVERGGIIIGLLSKGSKLILNPSTAPVLNTASSMKHFCM